MTIQTVSPAADLAMLLTAAVLVALAVVVVVQLVRRRLRPAVLAAGAAGVLVAVYGLALVGAGLAGASRELRPGDTKCFDDWCASMVAARQDEVAGTVGVTVMVQNRGRGRVMRSNLARAYLEVPGVGEVAPQGLGGQLQAPLQPGERVEVDLTFVLPTDARATRFVVVEGGKELGPATFEIGGEGSPFHGVAGWPL